MEQYGFFVNTDICTGCKACMTSYFDRNNLEVPQKFRKVYEFGGGAWEAAEDGSFTSTAFTYYTSMTCNHCDNPACVENCPTGAMKKDPETGIVNNDKSVCIGCMTCEKSCPKQADRPRLRHRRRSLHRKRRPGSRSLAGRSPSPHGMTTMKR